MASRKRLMSGWGPIPGRTAVIRAEVEEQALAPAEKTRRAPGRKDTRAWCRGKEGREHKAVIVFCPPLFRCGPADTCEWGSRWSDEPVTWRCHHELHCGACGKVLSTRVALVECPAYPGSAEQKAKAEKDAAEACERWLDWRERRRPVIDGPQGYRRKRENA